jgi:enoyl-CoA hydratase/carnithine racemase
MREGAVADGIVLYQVDDKVCIITLNRPEKLNAVSRELQLALTEAFTRADADPATSVVLLRAEGRSFCAGYDIGAQPEGTDDWRSNPTKAHATSRTTARIRDGAVANEETGGRRSAGPCAGRRV